MTHDDLKDEKLSLKIATDADANTVSLEDLMDSLGPETMFRVRKPGPAQSTRLLKALCPTCGYVIRVTKKWADLGLPVCPADLIEFELESYSQKNTNLG